MIKRIWTPARYLEVDMSVLLDGQEQITNVHKTPSLVTYWTERGKSSCHPRTLILVKV